MIDYEYRLLISNTRVLAGVREKMSSFRDRENLL